MMNGVAYPLNGLHFSHPFSKKRIVNGEWCCGSLKMFAVGVHHEIVNGELSHPTANCDVDHLWLAGRKSKHKIANGK